MFCCISSFDHSPAFEYSYFFLILTTVMFSFTQWSSWIIIQLFHGRLIKAFENLYSQNKHGRKINNTNTIKATQLQSRQETLEARFKCSTAQLLPKGQLELLISVSFYDLMKTDYFDPYLGRLLVLQCGLIVLFIGLFCPMLYLYRPPADF